MIIDGTVIAKKIEESIKEKLLTHRERKPGLAFVLVGDNPSSKTYIRMKKKKCEEVGILSIDRIFDESISQERLLSEIEKLNADPSVDGILVQMPLPLHISSLQVMEAVLPEKDVDGFHPMNVGKLLLGEKGGFLPCTPHGIIKLLSETNIPVSGKHVVIVGRSNIVGKPLAALLMQKEPHCNATVTVAHSATEHLPEITKSADILIAAIGAPRFITANMVKKGAVVIDVGINRIQEHGKDILVGDVDFAHVSKISSYITPVPGGVGPMTIAMLMFNTFLSFQRRNNLV